MRIALTTLRQLQIRVGCRWVLWGRGKIDWKRWISVDAWSTLQVCDYDTYSRGESERKGEGQGLPLSSNITLEFSDPSVSKKILHYASARTRPGRVVGAPNPKAPGYLMWQMSECIHSKTRPYVWDSAWDCQTYPCFHPQIIPYSTPPLSPRPKFLVIASSLPLAGSWLIESFLGNEREFGSS